MSLIENDSSGRTMIRFKPKYKNGIPRYQTIAEELEHAIHNNWTVGDRLPNENELATAFKVNRHTIRHALNVLTESGLVVKRHGVGTFVADKPIQYTVGAGTRFTESLAKAGYGTESIILNSERLPAYGGVAKRLEIVNGEETFALEMLRKVDKIPFSVASHFVPVSVGEDLLENYNGGSLHKHIFDLTGRRLKRVKSLVTTVPAKKEDVNNLEISQSSWVLRVKSINIDSESGEPVEYVVTRFRPDRVELSMDFV